MPTVHDWINSPLGVVEGIFAQYNSSPDWEQKVLDFFREKLKDQEAASWVPSLNDVPLHYLKTSSLVKFRCMVQDMFDPEFYVGVYETAAPPPESKVLKLGKYRDMTDCEVDLNSKHVVTMERQSFYCVPIPGESQWVKDGFARCSQARVLPSTSYMPQRHKRSHEEEDDEMESQPHKQKEQLTGNHAATDPFGHGDTKRLETGSQGANAAASGCPHSLELNFPLPGEMGPACLVKVYEEWEKFKVNDVLEVYGILSVDPLLSVIAEEREGHFVDSMDGMESLEEQRAHSPPASLVPRVHMLHAYRLQHNNPLLPPAASEVSSGFLGELASIRAELIGFLTHVLLGDGLAAEYLLLHLLSNVYARRDVLPLGKFALNLSGCPPSSSYTEQLFRVLQQLVTCSHRVGMSLGNMNGLHFTPQKDYTANRLRSGILQLSPNTLLFLDETQLQQGQLDAAGVRNITALGNLISWQKVDYDFSYHQMEFPCNINVLIASEGKSLLPSDCHMPLQPQLPPPNIEEYMGALQAALPPSLLNKFRIYLTALRHQEYSISEELTKMVEEDFVEMRKEDPQSISADDLHRTLVVARLLSLSVGQSTLSRDRWVRAKHLEARRTSRTQQRTINSNEP
ncbi:mini-chromosome maintenance complex-binding protein [Brienomyrus brachyistius]|uniref:mini-chromosome maintenance complex-binding protein n=1 Tax=Brienomyrus brachyistius TaxID=42636 RepID=UPI0020B2A792|nr:mini-chromosome maintenance complex-binding protein [Brienomyrus brachyistius]